MGRDTSAGVSRITHSEHVHHRPSIWLFFDRASRRAYTPRMLTAALLGATLLGTLPVRLEADACPSAREIERRLETMLPATSSEHADVARVSRSAQGVRIELTSADGVLVAERDLDHAGSCAELADMVAVIVASWESDVHPEFVHAAPAPTVAVPAATEEMTPRVRAHIDVAAGVGPSLADSIALGAALAVTWFPRDAGLGARLSAVGETTHTTDVGIRQAHWNRWLAGLELDWRLAGAITSLDLHGGVALAILEAGGVDFDQNTHDTSISGAVLTGARWSLWFGGRWGAYADVTAAYCQRDQTLLGTTARQLPHFQAVASIGVAVGQSPGAR